MDSKAGASGKEGFWRPNDAEGLFADQLPPPPYQVSDVYMSFIGVRYNADAVRELLPRELEPVPDHTGTICVYSIGSGWGIAPFTACFVAVEVDGYHAPDGSPGYYLATGYYSGRGYQMMHFNYNQHALKGFGRHFRDGPVAVGVGGPDEAEVLTIKSRPGETSVNGVGARHYLGKRPSGGTNIFPIAYSGDVYEAEPISVDITDKASERMKLARPVELLYAAECYMSLTFGRPQPISARSDDFERELTNTSLLTSFSRIGRAAILVGAEGDISLMNTDAEGMIGDGIRVGGGKLEALRAADQRQLRNAIASAANGDPDQFKLDPIAIARENGRPLIVQAMPVDNAVTGRPSALILLNDPASPAAHSAAAALQLFGLTPHEARIAELVGSGLSPREAAEKLDNSEGTVRTSLTRIYQKLDINRQSELARIVARL